MSKNVQITFTQREVTAIMECLESMLTMMGAGDEGFDREAKHGYNSMLKAIKRSGFSYNRPDYSKTDFKV